MPTEAEVRQFKMELARREFFYYAHIRANDFYTLDRSYLESLCDEIQEFIETDTERALIINAPPRHGKSRTAQLAVEWALGKTKSLKIMTGSYNEMLATQFSKGVRNAIQEEKADESRIVYSDIFPDVRIKRGDAAMNLWSLEGGYNNYLATSPTGTATGFGADLLIIDDLIKNSMEANTTRVLEGHWSWFTNTMLSRLEANGKIIIIMTRWHSKDLAGRALTELPEMGYSVRHISYKALQEDGTMLCDEILPLDEYQAKSKVMDPAVASANYQQEPIDLRGRLYDRFKTYEEIPMDGAGNPLFTSVKLYCDTADTGSDYLCSIVYGVYEKEAYILDVVYTKAPMEDTEPEVANQ
ncbi:MAG: terminase, partial [Trichococcus flocculiformis]|nr:terminase [Trichococcus flocculiformis]